MKPDWTCVLFDLDGTLADSAPGITATLGLMFQELGMPVPAPAELLKYVGPPILDAFHDFAGMSKEKAQAALDIYRRFYLENGTNGVTIYPGIADLLRSMHSSPLAISLATSKPEKPALRLLDNANLTRYFDVVTGASVDETRSAKADVVAEALRRLEKWGADVSRPVMVGDRDYDIDGAAANQVPTIFVEWGYGSPAESAGAIASAATAAELRDLLLR
ncbi:MAG TPA: HAD hydrolase-like protein [Terrimesophilobacter sp.]|uniref:HAD hydrolase-like protein n=1 Tax=Terrimesophilobacter sp. TaxID=2906435 RepID=UPI002F91E141